MTFLEEFPDCYRCNATGTAALIERQGDAPGPVCLKCAEWLAPWSLYEEGVDGQFYRRGHAPKPTATPAPRGN